MLWNYIILLEKEKNGFYFLQVTLKALDHISRSYLYGQGPDIFHYTPSPR